MAWRAVRNLTGRDLRLTHAIGGRVELGGIGVVDDLWESIRRGLAVGALVLVDPDDPDPDAVAALRLAEELEDDPTTVTPDDPRADLDARVALLEVAADSTPSPNPGREHVQATPSATWTIPVVGFGRRPAVTLYVDGELVDADVTASSDLVVAMFPGPVAGSAVLT